MLTIAEYRRKQLVASKAAGSEIVRRVGELFALADGLERKYGAAVERFEKLTPAVLAKALRGELVAQDPNDEPAEKLVERIRAERESVGSTARNSRTRAKTRAPVKRIARRAKK